MNLPNKLTMLRIICVPVFCVLYAKGMYVAALIVFAAASLTDMLDGYIARKYDLVTNFGKIMDPLADKILVYSAFCLMIQDMTIPAWMLIVILFREFLVAGMRTVAASEGIVIDATMAQVGGPVAQIVDVYFGQAFLLCTLDDALVERTREQFGQHGDDVDAHYLISLTR